MSGARAKLAGLIDRRPLRAEGARTTNVPFAWFLTAVVVWAVAVVYVAQAHLPKNVAALPLQNTTSSPIRTITPQGWAFFTKSPRDAELAPFRKEGGEWRDAARTPHAKPSNIFGLDRASRSQGIEMALLLNEAPTTKWADCADSSDVTDCLEKAKTSGTLKNPSPDPTLCGRAAVVQMRPVPWAWRDLMPAAHTPEKAAVWEVTC